MGYRPELEFLDDLDEDLCAIVPFPDIISFYEHPHVRPPKYLTEKGQSCFFLGFVNRD